MAIRPEAKARYDAALKQAAGPDLLARAAAQSQAAEAFAGSTDREELELRHRALADAGNILRGAGKLADAEAAYERFGRAAAAELGSSSEPALLGRYFVGLVRSDRSDFNGSAAALKEA